MDWIQILVILGLVVVLAIPTGKYLAAAYSLERTKLDRWFGPVEKSIFKIAGINPTESMSWKQIAKCFLILNVCFFVIGYLLLRLQGYMPLNPSGAKNIDPLLAFNTAASFAAHAEIQHYSGDASFSTFTQMAFVMFLMFGPVSSGLAMAMAVLRGFTGQSSLGNFHSDVVRTITRLLLPFSIPMTLLLVWQGVPQTLSAHVTAATLEGAQQIIAVGPVAVIESLKQFASNGGGFYGVNSAHPFENPNSFVNVIQLLSMCLLPTSLTVMIGHMVKNRKQGWMIFISLGLIMAVMIAVNYHYEIKGNPLLAEAGLSQDEGNMEGKEVRFGIAQSALFTGITGATTTGAVNTMHDTLTPIGGMVPLIGILLNTVFGETGAGIVNVAMYLLLAVFISGLMVGRTPELFGRKIEHKEMKQIMKELIIVPFIALVPAALALTTHMGLAGITNPGAHGATQVIYEFASSAASNGSGFEGLADNSPFWNISTGIVIMLGRYVPFIVMLGIAASLHRKTPSPITRGTIKTDNYVFSIVFVATILIIGALSYFPFLALGPITEWLSIR